MALLAPLAAGSAFAAMGQGVTGAGSYGQELLTRVMHQHQNVKSMSLYATLPNAASPEAIASSTRYTGAAPRAAAAEVLKSGRARFRYHSGRLEAILPLLDVSDKRAGVMTLTLQGKSRRALTHETYAIREYLKRNTSYAANLVQKALWDPHLPLNSYAQDLVDQELALHPDVIILAIHAATPKNATPEILGSNIGRIGKPDDSDDARVVNEGKTNLEVNTKLERYEVELPLNDAAEKRIGALGVVFPLTKGTNQQARHREAIRIRDELARKIPSVASLVEPRY
jgi:hypothetical protein